MDNFTPVSALSGGVLIGLASVWLLAANGRIAGVSGILHGLFGGMTASPPGDRALAGGVHRRADRGAALPGMPWCGGFSPRDLGIGWVALAGALVGFGTRVGGGCTSGHGVCGLGRFSLRSLVAVMVFMATGMAATFVMRHVL